MMRPLAISALAFAMALAAAPAARAQSMADRLREKAQQRIDEKVDRATDKVLDEFDGAIACVIGDTACEKRAKANGKKVVRTDSTGTVLPAERQPADSPARQPRDAAASDNADQSRAASTAAAGASPGGRPGEGAWANFDFVPGERVLFAEDFSRERVGNFPRRIELVTGNMEVVEWRSTRWLRASSAGAIAIPLPEKLGTRFTVEFDASIPWEGIGIYSAAAADKLGPLSPERTSATVYLSGTTAGVARANSTEGSLVDPRTLFADMFPSDAQDLSRVFHVRMEADGRYVKVYMDEKRVANIPNADFGRADKLIFEIGGPQNEGFPLIGNISVNAGGKQLYDALLADGRVSTQGILFDVGSDHIRGESTPTLKQIGDMLTEHPDLKLAVEGHTDNTGTATANQTLSTKRAQAIVTYLTATYHISAARLTPKGLGQAKPVGSNDTPEGRQANRRVELVKM